MEQAATQELIEFAIETEKLGSIFYEKMARRLRNETEVSELFLTLSQDEKKHERDLNKVYKVIKVSLGSNEAERRGALRIISRSEFFIGKDGIYTKYDDIHTGREALDRALRLERKTLEYYTEIESMIGRNLILDAIIDMERHHIKLISALYLKVKCNQVTNDHLL